MKNKSFFLPASILLLFVFLTNCSKKLIDIEASNILVKSNTLTDVKLSSIFTYNGFTQLEPNRQDLALKGIDKLLFSQGKIFVLDNTRSDFQNVWVFDQKNGAYSGKIGHQSAIDADGYDGLTDICINAENELLFLVGGKMSFMKYGLDGKYISTIKNGVYGDGIERAGLSDQIVVYNEFGASEVSGYNALLYYDNNGNLLKRRQPYSKEKDGQAYKMTGFLTKSDGQLYYNPPFCDTIYVLEKFNEIPKYIFDFGASRMPAKSGKIDGMDAETYSYISDHFVKVGNFVLFNYIDEHKNKVGVYDESSGKFLPFEKANKDALYPILQLGQLYNKDEYSFAMVLFPGNIKYLFNNNLIDIPALNKQYPDLLDALQKMRSDPNSNPIVLYLNVNTTVSLNSGTKF